MYPVLHPTWSNNQQVNINKFNKSKESLMKTLSSKARLAFFMLVLVLFTLAAGAPFATGTVGG